MAQLMYMCSAVRLMSSLAHSARHCTHSMPPRRLAVLSKATLTLSITSFSASQPLVMLDMSTHSVVSLISCTACMLIRREVRLGAALQRRQLSAAILQCEDPRRELLPKEQPCSHHEEALVKWCSTDGWQLTHKCCRLPHYAVVICYVAWATIYN